MDDDELQTQLDDAGDVPDDELRAALERDVHDSAQALRDRELDDGAALSENTVGRWAVYDNSELRFWPGLDTHADRDAAQRELDELRPTTGHDLVLVEV